MHRLSPLALLVLATAAQAQDATVSQPWARATAPHQATAAAYLTITSPKDDALTGVGTSDAGMAMLHVTTRAGGMSAMSEVDSIQLPAGKPVALSPHGTHIMLMDLKHPLAAGQRLHLTLHLASGHTLDVIAPVLPIGAAGPAP